MARSLNAHGCAQAPSSKSVDARPPLVGVDARKAPATLKEKPIAQSDGSLLYRKVGSINGKDGIYEIAVNPETKTIFHRTWRSR